MMEKSLPHRSTGGIGSEDEAVPDFDLSDVSTFPPCPNFVCPFHLYISSPGFCLHIHKYILAYLFVRFTVENACAGDTVSTILGKSMLLMGDVLLGAAM
jgi:hypothetical protein